MAGTEQAPIVYPPLEMPASVERETVVVWSLGLALDADVYRPAGLGAHEQVPGVVLCHGIGGDKLTAARYAAHFAEAGMIAVSFSQSSWGASQGRMTIVGAAPAPDANSEMAVRVRVARDLVDPLDWVDCYRSVVDWLEGDPNVEPDRIGAWGTSFGGGTALYVASVDDRVRALAVQVPALFNAAPQVAEIGARRAREIARGQSSPIPDGPPDVLPNLPGTPHFARLARYRVGDRVADVNVPTLILDAAEEELFDTAESGARAHRILTERGIENRYEVLPDIDHYGIYFGGYARSCTLAREWFTTHLRGPGHES